MRHRQAYLAHSHANLIVIGAPSWVGDTLPTCGYYSSATETPWGYNPGPYMEYWTDMQDELSPERSGRLFHPCIHTKYEGARIRGSKVCSFDDGTIPLSLRMDHQVMYKPYLYADGNPWNSMADELASLADGNTSSSAALAVTLLEGAKTIAMMRNPFNLLKPNYRRSVRKLTARMLAKRASNVWLESYYGWKSFYQDVTQIAKATANFLNEPTCQSLEKLGERLTVKRKTVNFSNQVDYLMGTSLSSWTAASSNNWYADYGNKPTKGHYCRLVDHSRSTYYTMGCRQFMESRRRIATTRRLFSAVGLTSWRSIRDTIWEVIPFSFVVDWFVDTRGIWAPLNKWRLQEMDIKDVGYSSKISGEYNVQLYVSPYVAQGMNAYPWFGKIPSTQTPSVLSSVIGGKYTLYNRFAGFPPSYDVVSQFKGKGLSFIRGVNGAALITQLLANIKPRR